MKKKDSLVSTILISLFLVFIFRFVILLGPVPTSSMENTIPTGSYVLCTRFNAKDVSRYDIIRFAAPDEPRLDYIKRVIGLPGETIRVEDGKVYANEELLDDSFIAEKMNSIGDGVYKVPEGCYFMMGDNRNASEDSRFWKNKYVPEKYLKGKAVLLYYDGKIKLLRPS